MFTLWAALTRVEMPNSQSPLLDLGAYNFPWIPMTIGMIGHILVLGVGYGRQPGEGRRGFRRSLGRSGRSWLKGKQREGDSHVFGHGKTRILVAALGWRRRR